MRENIEYTLCKLYHIRYNNMLKNYVWRKLKIII
jgi:hypothetical protein